MQRTFLCPHCDKKYPVLPTLVGRKVRCTKCKSVFQLQYDGIAIKVETNTESDEPSRTALEAKPGAPALDKKSLGQGIGRDKGASQTRPQTRAIKRKTERIRQIRSSLKDAADSVVDSMSPATEAAPERGSQSSSEAVVRDGLSEPTLAPVVLTGEGKRQSQMRTRFMMVLGAALFLLYIISAMEPTAQQRALTDFSSTLPDEQRKYPHKMPAYRERMWIFTRDGVTLPPLVLNAKDATLLEAQTFDWASVVAACAPQLEGLEKHAKFAMWHEIGRAAEVEQLWAQQPNNQNIEEFYLSLAKKGIAFLRYEQLQAKLFDHGLPGELVYTASLLLAGTRSATGAACRDMGLQNGLLPKQLILSEFSRADGYLLIDAEGGYRHGSSHHYTGLVAGFVGFPGRADEWRVLDFRIAEAMDAFYVKKHNPLLVAAKRAHEALKDELLERRNQDESERR